MARFWSRRQPWTPPFRTLQRLMFNIIITNNSLVYDSVVDQLVVGYASSSLINILGYASLSNVATAPLLVVQSAAPPSLLYNILLASLVSSSISLPSVSSLRYRSVVVDYNNLGYASINRLTFGSSVMFSR